MSTELTPVSIRFEKNGFLYWQIHRTQNAAIYEQRGKDGKNVYYEVWRIRERKERMLGGRLLPAKEWPPADEDWGKYGWTFYTLDAATKKYNEVTNQTVNKI